MSWSRRGSSRCGRLPSGCTKSGPTVSQTVARMERDGLLMVEDDRHIEGQGLRLATR